MLRDLAKLLAGLALAAIMLAWVLHGVDRDALLAALAGTSVSLLLLGAVVQHVHNVFRAWRWRVLLEPAQPGIPMRPMIASIFLGYASSFVIPGRIGEVVRPAYLSSRTNVPIGVGLGSVLADRVLDALAIVVLFLVGIAITPLGGEAADSALELRLRLLGFAAVLAAPILALFVASVARARLERRFANRSGLFAWALRTLLEVSRGTDALWKARLFPRLAFHSLAAWTLINLGTWIGVRACGADVTFGEILILQPMLALGVALPTPGGAGGYHAMMKFGLVALFGVEEAVAVGAGLLVHVTIVVPLIALGALMLWTERVSGRDLLAAARKVRALGRRDASGSESAPTMEESS